MIIKLANFIGEIPRLKARLLPVNAAQDAFDVRLTDGALTPVRAPAFIASIADPPEGGYQSFFRDGNDWLGWATPVDVVRGPVAQDRLYLTGDGVPKLRVSPDYYPLALAGPSVALTAASGGGGTGNPTTLLYVYTWVTDFGEESEPSPASNEVAWLAGETITLSGFAATPSGRNVTKQRIYRSQTSASGVTGFYFLAERTAGTGNYSDVVDLAAIAEPLPSLDYNVPPDDLAGITAMPNGMMVAFSGKDLCFSEPWQPHAWPEKYRLTCDYDIVALAAFGSSVMVATQGTPYLAVGTDPGTMQMDKVELNQPCINARGVIDLGYTAAYPSPDGLVVVGASGSSIKTAALFTREAWQKLNPSTLVAGQYNGRYFASYAYVDDNAEAQRGTIIIDLSGEQPFLIRSRTVAEALWHDVTTGELFMLTGGQNIYLYDAPGEPKKVMTWRSKVFVTPRPINLGCILIEADDALEADEIQALEDAAAAITADNATLLLGDILGDMNATELNEVAINGDTLSDVPTVSQTATVNVYADGVLVATESALNSIERLPSGFLATRWEVEVAADVSITQVLLASAPSELREVA